MFVFFIESTSSYYQVLPLDRKYSCNLHDVGYTSHFISYVFEWSNCMSFPFIKGLFNASSAKGGNKQSTEAPFLNI